MGEKGLPHLFSALGGQFCFPVGVQAVRTKHGHNDVDIALPHVVHHVGAGDPVVLALATVATTECIEHGPRLRGVFGGYPH